MKVKIFVEVGHYENGKYVKEKRIRANSYVKGFIDILKQQFYAPATIPIIDTSGNVQNTSSSSFNFYALGAVGQDTLGVVVGIGTAAPTIDDYKIGTKILNGTAAGKLSYGLCSVTNPAETGSTRYFTLQRTFLNSSGGDIDVKECGIYCNISNSSIFACIEHTLLAFTIANGASKTITYTIGLTV